jgi:hypothetical protein
MVVVVVDTVEPLLLQNEPNFVLHFHYSTLQISTDNIIQTKNNTIGCSTWLLGVDSRDFCQAEKGTIQVLRHHDFDLF